MPQLVAKVLEKVRPLYYTCDYEYVILFFLLAVLFILGLRKKAEPLVSDDKGLNFNFDRNFSGALKGLASVMILMGHFATMKLSYKVGDPISLSYFMGNCANIALVWFMFISGFGLTKSKGEIQNHFMVCCKRLGKVFFPMAFVFVISLLLYLFLPDRFSAEEMAFLSIPAETPMVHHLVLSNIWYILMGSVRWYWYVWCILIFYAIFYASSFLAKKTLLDKSWVLFLMLAAYYVAAFKVLGPSLAHYYRLTWAFFLGHLFARWQQLPRWQALLMCLMALSTFFFEDVLMIASFVAAIGGLFICSWLNRKYDFDGKPVLLLGTVSYFYYLCHRRITWVLMCYLGTHDLLVWALVTIPVSWGLFWLYKLIEKNLVK